MAIRHDCLVQPLVLLILYVRDLAGARAFYDHAFGWKKTVDEAVYVEYGLNPGARVGLMPQAHSRHFVGNDLGARRPTDGCPRAELYFHVPDAEATVARLHELGARCTSRLADRDWGDRVAYFLDPDGYVLAVAEPGVAPATAAQ